MFIGKKIRRLITKKIDESAFDRDMQILIFGSDDTLSILHSHKLIIELLVWIILFIILVIIIIIATNPSQGKGFLSPFVRYIILFLSLVSNLYGLISLSIRLKSDLYIASKIMDFRIRKKADIVIKSLKRGDNKYKGLLQKIKETSMLKKSQNK